jgi:hypothetical protein
MAHSIREHSLGLLISVAVHEKLKGAVISFPCVELDRPLRGKVRKTAYDFWREEERPATITHVPRVVGKMGQGASGDFPSKGFVASEAVKQAAGDPRGRDLFDRGVDSTVVLVAKNGRDPDSKDSLLDVNCLAALEGSAKILAPHGL